MSSYNDNLILKVINNSESNNWNDAVHEWEIVDCYEEEKNVLNIAIRLGITMVMN